MKEQLVKRLTNQWVEQVLEQFNQHSIAEKDACQLLSLKRAQLYKLRKIWLKAKSKGESFMLQSSGRNLKRSLSPEIERFLHEELSYIKKDACYYRGRFNFAFISEKVEREFNIHLHRNTIRRFAINNGYYQQTRREIQKPCIRFEMDSIGALFQHDTSHHVWLPISQRYHDLIMTKDDHSRMIVAYCLHEVESTWSHLSIARKTFEDIGIPLAYYVDRHSIFKFNLGPNCIHYIRHISEEEGKIQFKRALNSLDISVIYASDAESKGKIEKSFDYFQRRLPSECERYKVRTVNDAMPILDELVYFYNTRRIHEETQEIPLERWNRALKEGRAKLRPLPSGINLDTIFSLHFQRTVKPDGRFSLQGNTYRLKQLRDKRVTVALIPQRKIMVLNDNNEIIWQYHFEGYR